MKTDVTPDDVRKDIFSTEHAIDADLFVRARQMLTHPDTVAHGLTILGMFLEEGIAEARDYIESHLRSAPVVAVVA